MRLEKAFDRRFFGYRSILGWNHWRKAAKRVLFQKCSCSISDRLWCLVHGFTLGDLALFGSENLKKNYKDYLSDRDYYKLHPINGAYSFWIDDKITMKYVLSKYDEYLPEYYFQIEDHQIMRLSNIDAAFEASVDGIIAFLEAKGILAAKRIWGSLGLGFYRLEYRDEKYFVNGEQTDRAELKRLLSSLNYYLFMEYIVNHHVIRNIWPGSTNTIRVLIANIEGELVLMRTFMRFGNAKSNCVDNAHAGGIEAVIDEDTGRIVFTYTQDISGKAERISHHPDSGASFDIQIPYWDEMLNQIRTICSSFPQLRYMGFDVAITEDSFKIIEVNSQSGLMAAQMKAPLLKDPKTLGVYRHFGLKR